jgi:glycosyltransferase involved in cell wall biosynthesis
MNNSSVSICVPTYNGREHLKECIASIRAQSFKDFEVVICDDQSSDGTLDFARELAKGDERFRFIQNPRRFGLVGNWNNCMGQARGEWIKFVFQDDLIERRCVERLVTSCEERKKPFGFCRRRVIFDDLAPATIRDYFEEHQKLLSSFYGTEDSYVDPVAFARMAAEYPDPNLNLVGEPTVALFHRSLVKTCGSFVPAMVQACDSEFWMRLATNVGVVHVAEPLATFRVHSKSTTSHNTAGRAYAVRYLDPLIARHLFLHEKSYAAFRTELFLSSGRLRNWWRLIRMAHEAWRIAVSKSGTPELQGQWNEAVKAYPEFQRLAFVGRFLMKIHFVLAFTGLNRGRKKSSFA